MTVRRALTTAVLALAAWCAAAAPVQAQDRQRWRGCFGDLECTRLAVPLDRSGAVRGTVSLRVTRGEFAGRRADHLMYLSGGPGGAGIIEMIDVLLTVPSLVDRFNVIGFDQRGTGASGLLRCPAIERDGRLRSTSAGRRCAERLGARRAFYTTPDSVADMEAIRKALGVRKLTLFGISYGTTLALAYARAYPARVERLILDSVADPDDRDPYGLAGFRAMPPTLRSLCRPGCASDDPAADLAALVARLRRTPMQGEVFGADGKRRRQAVDPVAIADLLYDADYLPALRAGVPAAVRAALSGDAAPLLRLLRISAGFAVPSHPADFSAARYAAVCEETPLPWPRGTPGADRLRVAVEGAAALGPAAFFPFDARTAFADEIELCLRWPDPGRPEPPAGGAYPDVPALLLQGEEDLRTPPEASARIASLLPRSARVTVPGVGHAVVGADPSNCGIRQLRRWLAGDRVRARCPRVETGVPRVTVPPASFRAVEPADGVSGSGGDLGVRRTVAALDATLADLGFAVSPGAFGGERGGGLRGGTLRLDGRGRLVVAGLVVVPGVRVAGRELRGGALRLGVTGANAVRGRVAISPRGRLTGRLGGRRVRATLENGPPRPFGLFSAGTTRAVASVAVSTPVAARP
jgi:pimeloyl-ACP methyl ester carboxylesterase